MSETSSFYRSPERNYHFDSWNGQGVAHAFTTRHSFLSDDFNLSYHTREKTKVVENRDRLKIFLKAESLTIPKQCHGKQVIRVTHSNRFLDLENTDALVTNEPGLAIGVLGADCVPLLFWDPVHHIIGAAHAGWKGTVAGIGQETVKNMVDLGSVATDIRVLIGPSISVQNFEVGEDVVDHFKRLKLETCVVKNGYTKPHVDLWQANEQLLMRSGILKEHIQVAGFCTYEHTDEFYSARKEGFASGRFGAFILLKEA